jgi:hypothetical protein
LPRTDPLPLGFAVDFQLGTGYHRAVPPWPDDPESVFPSPVRPFATAQPALAAQHSPFGILHQAA